MVSWKRKAKKQMTAKSLTHSAVKGTAHCSNMARKQLKDRVSLTETLLMIFSKKITKKKNLFQRMVLNT